MTNRDWAILAFKVLGVWCLTAGTVGLADVPFLELDKRGLFALIVPSVAYIGIGLFTWLRAEALSVRVFPKPIPAENGRLHTQRVLALSLCIIGVLMVTQAIPALVRVGSIALIDPDGWRAGVVQLDQASHYSRTGGAKANAVAGVVRLLIGAGLVLGRDGLSTVVGRLRREFGGSLVEDADSTE
jgi:hypothetical protein